MQHSLATPISTAVSGPLILVLSPSVARCSESNRALGVKSRVFLPIVPAICELLEQLVVHS
jgi:hypothetical protein